VLRRSLDAAKFGGPEKLEGFARLDRFARRHRAARPPMPISKPSSRTSAQSRHRWEKHVAQAISWGPSQIEASVTSYMYGTPRMREDGTSSPAR
jgi:hypothetical protein